MFQRKFVLEPVRDNIRELLRTENIDALVFAVITLYTLTTTLRTLLSIYSLTFCLGALRMCCAYRDEADSAIEN